MLTYSVLFGTQSRSLLDVCELGKRHQLIIRGLEADEKQKCRVLILVPGCDICLKKVREIAEESLTVAETQRAAYVLVQGAELGRWRLAQLETRGVSRITPSVIPAELRCTGQLVESCQTIHGDERPSKKTLGQSYQFDLPRQVRQ